MSSSPDQIKEELLHIEIAVELDQGKSTNEVAEKFGIKLLVVKAIAKIIGLISRKQKPLRADVFLKENGKFWLEELKQVKL